MFLVDHLGLAGQDPQMQSTPEFMELGHARLVDAMTMPGQLSLSKNAVGPLGGPGRDRAH